MLSDYQAAVLVNVSLNARAGMAVGALCGGLVGAAVRLARGRRTDNLASGGSTTGGNPNRLAKTSACFRPFHMIGRIAVDLALGLFQAMLPAAFVSGLATMAIAATFVALYPNNSGFFEVPDWATMLQVTVALMTAAAIALCLPMRPTSTRRAVAATGLWLVLGGIDGAAVSLAGAFFGIDWRFDNWVVVAPAIRGALVWGLIGAGWRISAEGLARRKRRLSPGAVAPSIGRVAESPWD